MALVTLPWGSLLFTHCGKYHRDDAFHSHRAALQRARRNNIRHGFKVYKVVVIDGHFHVVDHTFEAD